MSQVQSVNVEISVVLGRSTLPMAQLLRMGRGAVIPLDAITVNLAGGHYLKIHLALQATAAAGTTIDGSQALDLTVSEFSNLPMAQLSSTDGRDAAKAQLLKAVEKAYKDQIMDIYFTEFVMQ